MQGYREQIREFLRSKKRISRAKRSVAEFFLTHPEDVAFLTLQDLSSKINVSPSTISRTSIEMGFNGFPDLQEKIRFEIKSSITPVERLKDTPLDTQSIWEQSIEQDEASLRLIRTMNPREKFLEAIELFATAPSVYAFSLRSSYPLTFLFSLLLFQVRPNVRHISLDDGLLTESLFDMKSGDVCFVVSFPRYTRIVLQFAKRARIAGCRIVSITDNELSPLAISSDLAFYCPYESKSFFNSNVAAEVIINALLSGVQARLGQEAIQRLAKHSASIKQDELCFYDGR